MTRRILAVFAALLLAAVGTAAVLLYVQKADERAVADVSPVEVLVAKGRIPAGTTGLSIRERQLTELIPLPAGSLPENEALASLLPELDTLVVTSDLQPGQVLLRRMFSAETRTSGGLAIPEGRMAVAFTVTQAAQVAGYVRPGSEVALYVSYRMVEDTKVLGPASDDPTGGTAVLLDRVDVIAVGARGAEGATTTTPLDEGELEAEGETADTVLVTVAVDPASAAKIIQAANANAIHLALLSDGAKPQVGAGTTNATVFR